MKNKSAFTLAEVLVVMIVTGIVVNLLWEGVDLTNRYVRMFTQRLSATNELLTASARLHTLFTRSDSIRQAGEQLCFYRGKEFPLEMQLQDSLLVLSRNTFTDTLFREVVSWQIIPAQRGDGYIDRLRITLRYRGQQFTLIFGGRDYELKY